MKNTNNVRSFAALLLAAAALACSSKGNRGSARITVSGALSNADINQVIITVHGAGITPDIVYNLSQLHENGTPDKTVWVGEIDNIPAGTNRTFTAKAYNSATVDDQYLIYDGAASPVTINAGVTAQVLIAMQQTNHPPPIGNVPPLITFMTASTTEADPQRSESIDLTAGITDPDDDYPQLSYSWSANGGSFSNGGGSGAAAVVSTTWYPPALEGPYVITLRVTDPKGGAAAVNVTLYSRYNARSGGQVTVTAAFNTAPTITMMSAEQVQVGMSQCTTLHSTVTDADSDTIGYNWYVTGPSGCSAYWPSAPFYAAASQPYMCVNGYSGLSPADARCTVRLDVTDARGLTNTGTITLWFEPPTTANFKPQIYNATQDKTAAFAGDTVNFHTEPTDPDGSIAAIQWTSVPAGYFGSPNSASTDFRPPCTSAHQGDVTATITVTDNRGLTNSRDFTVNSTCAASCTEIANGNGLSGNYYVDPDGPGTGAAEFSVYCENDPADPGWALVGKEGWYANATPFNTDVNTNYLTDGSMQGYYLDAHLDLGKFAPHGENWIFRSRTDTSNGGGPFQYTFWRPTPGAGLTTSSVSGNWCGAAFVPDMLWLARSDSETAGLPVNTTWRNATDWECSTEYIQFASRDNGVAGTPACVGDDGQTADCHAPSGTLANYSSGTMTSAYGDHDGVGHGWNYRATYWIKATPNVGGAP